MTRPISLVVTLTLLQFPVQHADSQENAQPPAQNLLDVYEAREFQGMPYRLMQPIDLADNPDKKYPLILSLHGGAGRGTDNRKNLFRQWNQIMAEEELRRRHPAFVVAPQSTLPWIAPGSIPEITEDMIENAAPMFQERLKQLAPHQEMQEQGLLLKVFDLLDALAEEFSIDTDRVYVLGHSMGGWGTWAAIIEQPERFAAAIPSAGAQMVWHDFQRIVDVPVWTFHGDADPVVTVEYTRWAFAKLKALKANTKYTELKGVHHGSAPIAFTYTGDDPEKGYVTHYASDRCDTTANVWDWLFAQRRNR